VAFKSNKRLSEGGLSKGYSTVIPELVVEVNSPADSYIKVLKKVNEWLKAGVIEVWLIDPEDRSIAVYDSSGNYRILDGNQVLEGGDILPGFKCKLDDVFN